MDPLHIMLMRDMARETFDADERDLYNGLADFAEYMLKSKQAEENALLALSKATDKSEKSVLVLKGLQELQDAYSEKSFLIGRVIVAHKRVAAKG